MVLESQRGEAARVVEGNPELADRAACPASTFKIVLAWSALESGVVGSGTRIHCADAHICPRGADLDLHQALLYSSNDFFRSLAPKIGRRSLEEFMTRSGYIASASLSGWLGRSWGPAVKGGRLRITPRNQHRFMDSLMADAVEQRRPVREQLLNGLRWPSPDPRVILHGKTGAAERAVWFTGFGIVQGRPKTVTVFCRGGVDRRPAVISLFYARFGLAWDPALLPPLE